MKLLKQGSSGEQVKIMQAMVSNGDIAVDGLFGKQTVSKVKLYQMSKGLVADGICGNDTWKSLYFHPSKYPNLYVMKIPFSHINAIDVLLKDKNKTYSVGKYASEYKGSVVINGALFSMGSGPSSWQNTTDLIVNGIINNGGNYTNIGMAFDSGKAYQGYTYNYVGKSTTDFVGGAPTLVLDGKKAVDMKGLSKSFYTAKTQRTSIGFDSKNLIIITTGQSNKSNLETIVQEFLYQKAYTAINLDGGGSTAMAIRGKTVFTQGRPIPSAISVKIKGL